MPAKPRHRSLAPVTVGAVTIRRYQLGDGRVVICYPTAANPRTRQTFAGRGSTPKARAASADRRSRDEAERRARELQNSGTEAAIFTAADRAEFAAAKKAIHGSMHSLAEVVAAGLTALRRAPHPVPAVVAELLGTKSGMELNGRYTRGLKSTLDRFAAAHPGEIRDITPVHIESFLRSMPVGPRRRDNLLNELRHLFEFARLRSYLPNEITAPSKVPKIHKREGDITFFTAAEMRLILAHVSEDWLPFVAIACFAGLRTEEITRAKDAAKSKRALLWSDFDWRQRHIAVHKDTAKTGFARLVPIQDNLFEWLRPWHSARGPVAPATRPDREFGKNARLEKAINRALKAAPQLRDEVHVQLGFAALETAPLELLTSFAWRQNALRHSYASYRAAVIHNPAQLAEEMGNSEAMIKQHYRNVRSEEEGRAWFAIRPTGSRNIVSFPADSATCYRVPIPTHHASVPPQTAVL